MKKLLVILICLLILSGCENNPVVDTNNSRVFYEIFVSSFSDSNNDGIGDLKGIINRLDYLNDNDKDPDTSLGVEGIRLTPIFKSDSYDGYVTIDHYNIDEEFGTMDDLEHLIYECHSRGIKVIIDIVMDLTSDKCEWFTSFVKAHQNIDFNDRYYDYYIFTDEGKIPAGRTFYKIPETSQYYEAGSSKDTPRLNYDCQYVKDEILDISRYYLAKGVDGFCFADTDPIYFRSSQDAREFFRWYTAELKKTKKDVYLIANLRSDTEEFKDMLNCFDLSVNERNGLIYQTLNTQSPASYTKHVEDIQSVLKDKGADRFPVLNLSDDDTDRSGEYYSPTTGKAYMAANLYILTPGSPFIYYGEEIGMKGLKGNNDNSANLRLAMLWGDGDSVKDPKTSSFGANMQVNGTVHDQLNKEGSLLKHYIKLINLRKANPALCEGTYRRLELSDQRLGAFEITYNNEKIYLIHNCSADAITLNTDIFRSIIDFVGYKTARYQKGELIIGPYTSVVLK